MGYPAHDFISGTQPRAGSPCHGEAALYRFLTFFLVLACMASAPAHGDDVKLTPEQLAPGTKIELSGQWLYKPGYAKSADETPEKPDATADGYVSVPVPQIL